MIVYLIAFCISISSLTYTMENQSTESQEALLLWTGDALIKVNKGGNQHWDSTKKYCNDATCDLCPVLLNRLHDIFSIDKKDQSGISYHRSCWRATSLDLLYTSRHKEKSPFSLIGKLMHLFMIPATLYIKLEKYNGIAANIALAGTLTTAMYAHWLVSKNNIPARKPDGQETMREIDSNNPNASILSQQLPMAAKEVSSCNRCGEKLLFYNNILRTVPDSGTNYVYHDHCAQEKAAKDTKFAKTYHQAKRRDMLTAWIPTPLHALNYLVGPYLLYAAATAFVPKLQSLMK